MDVEALPGDWNGIPRVEMEAINARVSCKRGRKTERVIGVAGR